MKIYFPNENTNIKFFKTYRHHELLFIYGFHNFQFSSNIDECLLIPVCAADTEFVLPIISQVKNIRNKIILICQETHASEGDDIDTCYRITKQYQEICDNVYYVTINYGVNTYNTVIFNDYCFNRNKAYFTEYDKFDMSDRLWTNWTDDTSFRLNPIKKIDNACKKFLIPNNCYHIQDYELHTYRYLARILLKNFCNEIDCFYSLPQEGIILDPEGGHELLHLRLKEKSHGTGFIPIANHYYENSIISAYGETIVESRCGTRVISEKTFNPLIKGHFILPIGYAGLIRDLQEIYGFVFPNWIDYSYDKFVDTEKRFSRYLESLNKIRNTPIEELVNLRNRDIAILEHNRSIFYSRPYHSLYNSLLNEFSKAGMM
jgi:hypothetical protein